MQDAAGFVNRGLAILWRDALQDLAHHYCDALLLIEADDQVGLASILHANPDLLDYRPGDEEGFQLLHQAARVGSVACVEMLVGQGALLDAPCGHMASDEKGFRPGFTPLLVAIRQARADIVCAMLRLGADPDAQNPVTDETALHLVAAAGLDSLVNVLIDAGANRDTWSEYEGHDAQIGRYRIASPLHVAAFYDQVDVIRALLKAGVDSGLGGPQRCQALHYAAARGNVTAVEALLAAGADPNAWAPFPVMGADLQMTPLHCALHYGQVEVVSMLMCYGAEPGLRDPGIGQDAFEIAQSSPDPLLAKLLIHALRGGAEQEVFSRLDARSIRCMPFRYGEMHDFLFNLLSEFLVTGKSLLVLSDWLVEMEGAENRPLLARAYREVQAGRTD